MNISAQPREISVRRLIRRDLPQVVEIESESFDQPWSEKDFLKFFRQQNTMMVVADGQDGIEGFCAYALQLSFIQIVDIAVRPSCRRLGVGKRLIESLVDKCTPANRRRAISTFVSDANLRAHLFFKSQGFYATEVVSEHFQGGIGAYKFVLDISVGPQRNGVVA